ncbi:MAG: hypothetical protein ACRC9N_08720, partial [Aeromonas sp.]
MNRSPRKTPDAEAFNYGKNAREKSLARTGIEPATLALLARKSPLLDPQALSSWKQVLSLLTRLPEPPLSNVWNSAASS